ncbi:MAG TPA: alpha-amylase family glycosyl hydrolase [Elusimicrobiales bacterium]|nr:alpha-amylase family glycosyl hydrolase [Elusimicrobiales bacterium]HOL62528.1 alpha-amylase family glycosyl hydrolase [Elusimicrobiales bacterium]HPO94544.1 alpha-amylase family glycosyl hydrolase [Elusimicrobiales bacterium]
MGKIKKEILNKPKFRLVLLVFFAITSFLKASEKWDFRDESIYFVITDRFVDGDKNNNDIYGDEYQRGNLRYYQGGDFKGLIENLDHIKDMGFTAIWITPPVMQPPGRYINSSKTYDAAGYHGYWGWDFSKIDPHLQSPGYTYKDLIDKAHKNGIKIIQDIVLNHAHGGDVDVSVKWYNDRGKVFGLGKMFDYFNDKENWFTREGPVLFDLLDFNDKNPYTRRWLIDIYKEYQNMGVDGFRLDTVVWVSTDFWKEFLTEMHNNKKDFFIFGEVWTNSDFDLISSYTKLNDCDDMMNCDMSVLDMPLSSMGTWGPLEEVFKGGDYRKVNDIIKNDYKYKDPTYLVVYLDNHDKPRFNGANGQGSLATKNQYIDALNFYFTVRGIPCISYGTEVQMPGGEDPDNRRYLGADGIKKSKNNPVYKHIRKLNAIRKKSVVLRKGVMSVVYSDKDLYVFSKEYKNKKIYVFLNKSDKKNTAILKELPGLNYTELWTGSKISHKGGEFKIALPPHSVRILSDGN